MTYDLAKLRDIEKRMAEAKGPCFAIEVALDNALGFTATRPPAAYTCSIDASIAILDRVLPGHEWVLGKGRTIPTEPLFGAQIFPAESGARAENMAAVGEGEHNTSLPIALCLAMVRALIVIEEKRNV